jgi:two-component system, LytTR family, response regulator
MRTIIVDDERLARKELQGLLAKFEQIEIVGEFGNADEALASIEQLKPDLIFLDIQMPGKNGFDLLEELEVVPKVIFVTAYDDFALRAFEKNAVDYLLKPVEEERLSEAIQKALLHDVGIENDVLERSGRLGQDDQVFLKDGDKCWFVPLSDVRMFESEGNYVRVFFHQSKPLILKSLNNLEDRLDNTFFRTNRKYIVNLKWIQGVENWFNGGLRLTLKDGTQLEVSRRQSARFRDYLSL